jgi:hypothetical protein
MVRVGVSQCLNGGWPNHQGTVGSHSGQWGGVRHMIGSLCGGGEHSGDSKMSFIFAMQKWRWGPHAMSEQRIRLTQEI